MLFWCYLLAYEKRRAIQNELPVLQYLFSFTPEESKKCSRNLSKSNQATYIISFADFRRALAIPFRYIFVWMIKSGIFTLRKYLFYLFTLTSIVCSMSTSHRKRLRKRANKNLNEKILLIVHAKRCTARCLWLSVCLLIYRSWIVNKNRAFSRRSVWLICCVRQIFLAIPLEFLQKTTGA